MKSARTSRRSSLAGARGAMMMGGGVMPAGEGGGEDEMDPLTEEFLGRLEDLEEKMNRATIKI